MGPEPAPRNDWLTRALLTMLAVVLPFELATPLLRFGPLDVTSIEVLSYPLAFAVVIRWLRFGPPRWTAVHTGVALWAASLLLSAILAPTHRPEAIKFALRTAAASTLFLIAADVIRTPAAAGRLMFALGVGATLAAVAAIIEIWLPDGQALVSAFKTAPTLVGGFLRAGGPFEYPNIGAMYWEATLPLILALGVWRARPIDYGLSLAAALLILLAIVLTVSRAGVLVTFALLAAMTAVPRRVAPGLRTSAVVAAIALLGFASTASSLPLLRFNSPDWASWYRAEYESTLPSDVPAGSAFSAMVTVRNRGSIVWESQGNNPITLGYCWHDAADGSTSCADQYASLPHEVPPATEAIVALRVWAPRKPGSYSLQWDMFQKGRSWFREYGVPTGDAAIHVGALAAANSDETGTAANFNPAPMPVLRSPDRRVLWNAALQFWRQRPLLGIGPDNFRLRYGELVSLEGVDERVHANNWYLETLADSGLAGAMGLLALMSTLAFTVGTGWWAARNDARLLGVGLGLGLGAFFVHGLVDYFLPFTATSNLFWLVAGAAVGMLTRADR